MAAETRWQDLYPDPNPVPLQQPQQGGEWQRSLQAVPTGYFAGPGATAQYPVGQYPMGQMTTEQFAAVVAPQPLEQLDVIDSAESWPYETAATAAATEYAPARDFGRAQMRRRDMGARHRPLEHRDVSGGWLRPAVFGAMDGLVTNASLIAGVGGGGAANHTIVLTGLAGLIAGAFSMATGEYISVCSQNELTEAEVAVEQLQHWRNPEGEEKELAEVFVSRGVAPELAETVAQQLSADPKQAVKVHVREELGIDPDDLPSPWTAAGASFASFTVGALLPLLPYLFGLPAAFALALVLAATASFAGGASVAQLTGRPPLQGGLRQFGLGALATGMTFLVGLVVGAHVS